MSATTPQFTVSPDFTPEKLSGWFIFNTWLQKELGQGLHLEMYDNFQKQRAAIAADEVDLIYANPFDASVLVREKGFIGVARPADKTDEAIIAVRADSAARRVEDLKADVRVALTDSPDVNTLGTIMLEPADLSAAKLNRVACDTYVLVAKALLRGDADVGIFLAEAYDGLSAMIRKDLHPLVRSQIGVVRHVLLAGPRLAGRVDELKASLTAMAGNPRGASVLETLGFANWEAVEQEDVEFMIDLIDTLTS